LRFDLIGGSIDSGADSGLSAYQGREEERDGKKRDGHFHVRSFGYL
jgi:hypothetical protein